MAQQINRFSQISVNPFTNMLTKFQAEKVDEKKYADIGFGALPKEGTGISAGITMYSTLGKSVMALVKSLSASTYQLLDMLMEKAAEDIVSEPCVILRLGEYFHRLGVTEGTPKAKEAREQLRSDLQILTGILVSYKDDGKAINDDKFHILDEAGIDGLDIISATFSKTMFQILKSYPIMQYPQSLWRVDSAKNPCSYYFLRHFAENKCQYKGTKREDYISVRTLIENSPLAGKLKEASQVVEGEVVCGLIADFECDLNALVDSLAWKYCYRDGTPIRNVEATKMTYNLFANLLVRVEWKGYPIDNDQRSGR